MSRYIDADKVYWELIEEYPSDSDRILKVDYDDIRRIVMDFIDDAPTAEVKPIVYGEWLYTGDMFNEGELVCSKCGHKIDVADKSNFCPNCGAIMRKESKE